MSPADLDAIPSRAPLRGARVRDVRPDFRLTSANGRCRRRDLPPPRRAPARARARGAVAQGADRRRSASPAHAGRASFDDRPARSSRAPADHERHGGLELSAARPERAARCSVVSARCRAVFRSRRPRPSSPVPRVLQQAATMSSRRQPVLIDKSLLLRAETSVPSASAVPDARNRSGVRGARAWDSGRARRCARRCGALLHWRGGTRRAWAGRGETGGMAGSRARRSRELPRRADVARRAPSSRRSVGHRVGLEVFLADPRACRRGPAVVSADSGPSIAAAGPNCGLSWERRRSEYTQGSSVAPPPRSTARSRSIIAAPTWMPSCRRTICTGTSNARAATSAPRANGSPTASKDSVRWRFHRASGTRSSGWR